MSSPIDEDAERMQLLNKRNSKPPHDKYFDILDLSTICNKCGEEKKSFCPHLLDNRSAWKSVQAENTLRDLMPANYFASEVGRMPYLY